MSGDVQAGVQANDVGGEVPSRACRNCGHLRDVHGAQRTPAGGWRCNARASHAAPSCRCVGYEPVAAASPGVSPGTGEGR